MRWLEAFHAELATEFAVSTGAVIGAGAGASAVDADTGRQVASLVARTRGVVGARDDRGCDARRSSGIAHFAECTLVVVGAARNLSGDATAADASAIGTAVAIHGTCTVTAG